MNSHKLHYLASSEPATSVGSEHDNGGVVCSL